MPIILNDLTNQAKTKQKAFSPKFFDSKLTGVGKTSGLLKDTLNPHWSDNDKPLRSENVSIHKRTYTNGLTTTSYIPFDPIPVEAWKRIRYVRQPDLSKLTKIGVNNDYELYIDMKVHSLNLEETAPASKYSTSGITRSVTVCYQLMLYNVYQGSKDDHLSSTLDPKSASSAQFLKQKNNRLAIVFTCSPIETLDKYIAYLSKHHYTINPKDVSDWLTDYELYEGICERSQQWQTTIDQDLDVLFENTAPLIATTRRDQVMATLAQSISRLEEYKIPLDIYKKIYASIQKHFPTDEATILCKQNLNLLLSDTLNSLNTNKSSLTSIHPLPANTPVPPTVQRLSAEQYAAVSSTDPLILVQSGAGTGKALDLNTPILTPTGWKPMLDIKIGDQVIGSDGRPCNVTGVWDHDSKEAYKLTFQDNASIIACDEHLWSTMVNTKNGPVLRDRPITTKEWIESEDYNDDYLPMVQPVKYGMNYCHARLPVKPEDMGVYLAIKGDLEPEKAVILPAYMLADPKDRKALLYGLFKHDGLYLSEEKPCVFMTESGCLANDVMQLIWSLGIHGKIERNEEDMWVVSIIDPSWNPLDHTQPSCTKPLYRTLKKAEYLGRRPMRCITVDAPDHLYVAKDFIVTHNSTVILSRIDYMIAAGVKPEDITVLSFTNAAADHIKEKNPNIHSMTIAKMIHTIYEQNFKNHELSSLDTIINSLEIYFPRDSMARTFAHYCKMLLKNDGNAFTAMNNFIEHNFDDVIRMLDRLKQTSLELEIIICYQRIEQLQEPPEVQSRYLIIDEVQDNSIFEFIYAIKYVDKHKESLFMVGDCSQTLYEFRASNPKAINVLEGSGVFSTFKLQVNYRSNQEILDFANILLQNIEANQYANIQLRANNLSPVTLQSFKEKVNFEYFRMNKITDFYDAISSIFVNRLKPYIDDKLAKHEQVAFLAFSRRHVFAMEHQLKTMYPNNTIANLAPSRTKNSTVFSEFIRRYWNEVKFSPSKSICAVIANTLMDKITFIAHGSVDKLRQMAQTMLANWRNEQQSIIDMWQRQYQNGQLSFDDFMANTKESMLKYEIRVNSVKQALMSAQNEANKNNQANQNADIVLSTIHSAKGLEFPHVVLICRAENQMDEEKKRMYYVALTRAMQSEFVVAYEITASPQMEADYKQIIKILEARDQAQKQASAPPSAPSSPAPVPSVPDTDD